MSARIRIPMADPVAEYRALRPELDEAIARVLGSGVYALGPEVTAFERALAAFAGTRHAVGVASGTAALQLALEALGIGPGDEVITVPNSDISTTAAVTRVGATPVWVDCDRRSLTMDPALVEARITPRTRAILVVHLFGIPARLDALLEICERRSLILVEDAALALGAEFAGRRVGTFGRAGCLSLAPYKMLGAYGDAGAVLTADAGLARRVRILRNYGYPRSASPSPRKSPVDDTWRMVVEGHNERLDTLQAAILGVKLRSFHARLARRREIARRYRARLEPAGIEFQAEPAGSQGAYLNFTVFVPRRDAVRRAMLAAGIATRIYYAPPLHLQPAYRRFGCERGSFPAVETAADEMLSLPVFPELTDVLVDEVADTLVRTVHSER